MSVDRTTSIDDVLWVLGRVTLYSGFVSWSISTVAIFGAIALAPWFSWTEHALSELGHTSRASAPVFNNGLILAGVVGTVFVLRVGAEAENLAHWTAIAIMLGATGALTMIGGFPIGHPYHDPASITFFVTLTYGLFAYGTGEILADRRGTGVGFVWLGLGHATGWVLWMTGLGTPGVAIPEFAGSVVLLAWIVTIYRQVTDESLSLTRQDVAD